ncbi:spondin domain-containing protein [uncultured Tenacibaculum sp.]|uniref:spondin domain-containing protein n=1 Tax=uncultured Tenacibaculum sp. TaxID=174713 RepID=UPI0026171CF7|nr:spondin domain-containing protein [uncultured Tenacibaculum sp.]
MKTFNYFILAMLLLVVSCSDDEDAREPDNGNPPTAAKKDVVFNEIKYQGSRDLIEIYNRGTEAADISEYWLCLGPGAYQKIGDLTPESGSTTIPADGYLVVSYNLPDDKGGLGLYSTNEFTNPDAIIDFVQYGDSGSARENVAASAGIWTAGDFVPTVKSEDNSIIYDGEGNGVMNWAETTQVTFGNENVLMAPADDVRSVVINEVNYGQDKLIELWNNGDVAVDLSDYWLCLGPGQYLQIRNASVVSGSAELNPGEFLVVNWDQLSESAGLGFYSTNAFTNPDAILDFVQWGASGSARENVAVAAGIWTSGDFVPQVRLESYSLAYDGEGDTISDWKEAVNPTFGRGNAAEAAKTRFTVTITNKINYLGTHVFNTPTGAANPGPVTDVNGSYSVKFKAVPGTKLSFASMSAATNDWFFAPKMSGIDLFDASGSAVTGDISEQIYLWDAGTEEEDPATIATEPNGGTAGSPDDDNTVRVVNDDVTAYLRTELAYDSSTRYFTLTLTNLMGAAGSTPTVLTPGLAVLHAQKAPLFTVGQPDRGYGLKEIAEAGNPMPLYQWFNATGSQGAPLRLSSSYTVFSPAVLYAFSTAKDPWFVQGEQAKASSGLEEIAEDGNNQVAYEYLKGLGLPVAKSNETAPVKPGESLTFTIEVPQGLDYKLGFGTMLVDTNDWFISYNNNGVALFDENGTAFSGTSESDETYLFDAGTEADEEVGFGANQAPRQSGPNTGATDGDNLIRRVATLNDVQFGKGAINSSPGVTWFGDPRGGYNLIEVNIQPQ